MMKMMKMMKMMMKMMIKINIAIINFSLINPLENNNYLEATKYKNEYYDNDDDDDINDDYMVEYTRQSY